MNLSTFVLKNLENEFGAVKTPLIYNTPLELLIAVILSAQCTDKLVNKITPSLFKAYPSVESFSKTTKEELEKYLNKINYYKTKSKNIIKCCKKIVDEFNGVVPNSMTDLLTLAGVGRKTANVILNEYYKNYQGIVVDTHVKRLSNRIGLSIKSQINEIEKDLMNLFNKNDWEKISLLLIYHGRKTCIAQKPKCDICILKTRCYYYSNL